MFILIEGIKNIWRAKVACFIVGIVIGAAILVGGWFFLLTVKLQETSGFFNEVMEIEAYLDDPISREETASLFTILENDPGIKNVRFISKDSAAAIFLKLSGEDVTKVFGENPLPSSFRLTLESDILLYGKLDSLVNTVSALPGVDDVIARREYMFTLLQYRRMVWIIHISAGLFIFGLALIVILNVIKLSIHSRRKSIEIMKLIGATNRFISAPFIIEGLTDGFFGGIAGCIFSYTFIMWLEFVINIDLSVHRLFFPASLAAGCVIGVAGSTAAVRKFL